MSYANFLLNLFYTIYPERIPYGKLVRALRVFSGSLLKMLRIARYREELMKYSNDDGSYTDDDERMHDQICEYAFKHKKKPRPRASDKRRYNSAK